MFRLDFSCFDWLTHYTHGTHIIYDVRKQFIVHMLRVASTVAACHMHFCAHNFLHPFGTQHHSTPVKCYRGRQTMGICARNFCFARCQTSRCPHVLGRLPLIYGITSSVVQIVSIRDEHTTHRRPLQMVKSTTIAHMDNCTQQLEKKTRETRDWQPSAKLHSICLSSTINKTLNMKIMVFVESLYSLYLRRDRQIIRFLFIRSNYG